MNVTYLKKISMNSYFFFGFHIFKYFTVTFMYQQRLKTSAGMLLTHKCYIIVLKNVKSKEKVRIHTYFF